MFPHMFLITPHFVPYVLRKGLILMTQYCELHVFMFGVNTSIVGMWCEVRLDEEIWTIVDDGGKSDEVRI
jgi:hypothetical protein